MKIMAVNAGSSSLKFQLFEMPSEDVVTSGVVERIGYDNALFAIKVDGEKIETTQPVLDHGKAVELLLESLIKHNIIKDLNEIKGVGHRVVQGGEKFKESAIITDEMIRVLTSLNDLAPLHNPANITGIEAFRKVLPNINQVAVFDTTFHQTMKAEAYLYSTPYEWYEDYGVRKYGFHGTSHQYVSQRAMQLLENPKAKIIVCHLGNGASLCAVDAGKSIDTSMGLTPLEGIPMGTRSGNIDPAILSIVANKEGRSVEAILDDLNKRSGYLGVSGLSNDSRDIIKGMKAGNMRAKLAHDIQMKRIADYIGSYYVYMGGLDAIVFTAGIGENESLVRKHILERISVLGVIVDDEANQHRGEREITTKDSKVRAFIIPTNEEVMIARAVIEVNGH